MTTKTTLLIVDDEETIHKALQRTLRREPYEILHAYDSAEAAAMIAQHPEIAMVLCDHYMPGTHGLDLLIELRRRYPQLVTVLLTAQADLQLVMAALNEGHIHKFLTKPWDSPALRATLADLITQSAGASRPPEPAASEDDAVERRLREELMPLRDTSTGAFIIDGSQFE